MTVEIDRDPANPVRVPVRVAVLERPAVDVGVPLGFGTDAGLRGELSLRHRNAFGRGYDKFSALQADKTRQLGYADFYLPPGALGLPIVGAVAAKDSVGILAENTSTRASTRAGAQWPPTGSFSTRRSDCASASRSRRSRSGRKAPRRR